MLRTALALLLLATVASAEDSPLVALAKRSNRAASKTVVITNETVTASKGRISDPAGDTQPAQTTSAPATPRAAATPAPARTPTPQATPAAAPAYPAKKTGAVAASPEYALPTTARNIEPQSTVRNVDPQSTARNVDPQSTVKNVDPQSTARTIEPQVTVRNIEPQTTNTPPQQ